MSRTDGRALLRAALASRYWSESEARIVLDAHEESGQSESAFCRERGLVTGRLQRWRSRLRTAAELPALGVGGETQHDFLPVRLVVPESAESPEQEVRADCSSTSMELVLRGGHCLRLGADFDPGAVARLVAALEGVAAC